MHSSVSIAANETDNGASVKLSLAALCMLVGPSDKTSRIVRRDVRGGLAGYKSCNGESVRRSDEKGMPAPTD
ncbi:hypothetical protein [Agrobacterium tumefaciens]|uniref:hypothetical protein n=1 Tax=Agrobacterium tumefaciens TaxID=358 RepID=UPI00105366FE|nr:hypothetical protein [Agrobacterium tumefaciens]TCV46107.1 hypothetical protein EDB97_11815 [Agrobacterium tumefaciens]